MEIEPIDKKGKVVEDDLGQYLNSAGELELLSAEEEAQLAKDMEIGKKAEKILSNGVEKLSNDEIEELTSLVEAGQASRDHFISSNLLLVVSIAKRYQGGSLKLPDLIQEGNLGLVRAVDKFDYKKGFKLSTYATWWIRQAITRAIGDKSKAIRLPMHVGNDISTIDRLTANIPFEEITQEMIDATGVNLTLQEYKDLKSLSSPISLNQMIRSEGGDEELGYFVSDTTIPSIEEQVTNNMQSLYIYELMEKTDLSNREMEVLVLRYGLDGKGERTLEEVGRYFDLTRERVRQIEGKAKSKMLAEHQFGSLKEEKKQAS